MPSAQYTKVFHALLAKIPKEVTSIEKLREGFDKMMVAFPADPDITMEHTVLGSVPAFWIHAPQSTRKRVILFFHGGGYVAGSTSSHQCLLGRLTRASGCDIIGVDYRLAPEFPFPAALEDAEEAYRALLQEGFSPKQIIVAGASAGGGLAFSLLEVLKQKKEDMPLSVLGLCPWLDLSFSEKSIKTNTGKDILVEEKLQLSADWYLPKDVNAQHHQVSPLFCDPTGFPPIYITIGTSELLFDECIHFANNLQKCGVPVHVDIGDEMFHCWFLYASKIPEGQKAIEKMAEFIWSV